MKNEILTKTLDLASFAFENGEILNAYTILTNAPILVREDAKKSDLFTRIKARIDTIASFQAGIRHGAGFADPPDVSKVVVYKKLVGHLRPEHRRLLDVGCFSGWVGRNLALKGIQVHGIDLDPDTTYMAQRMATGTMASYETLEGTRAGLKYPMRFDGAMLFDVLEHVFDPYVFLSSIEATVKKGGTIFINLPAFDPAKDVVDTVPDGVKEHLRAWNDEEVAQDFPQAQVEKIINEDGRTSYFIVYQLT